MLSKLYYLAQMSWDEALIKAIGNCGDYLWGVYILLMIFAGYLGGTINFYLDRKSVRIDPKLKDKHHTQLEHFVIGLGATVLIPLFLNTISSKLIPDTISIIKFSDLMIYFSFCLIAAISGEKFIQLVTSEALKKAKEALANTEELSRNEKHLESELVKYKREVKILKAKEFRNNSEYSSALRTINEVLEEEESGRAYAHKAICLRMMKNRTGEALEAGLKSVKFGSDDPEQLAWYYWNLACYQSLEKSPIDAILDSINSAVRLFSDVLIQYKKEEDLDFAKENPKFKENMLQLLDKHNVNGAK